MNSTTAQEFCAQVVSTIGPETKVKPNGSFHVPRLDASHDMLPNTDAAVLPRSASFA